MDIEFIKMLATPFLFVFLISLAAVIIYLFLKTLFQIIFLRKSLSEILSEAKMSEKVRPKFGLVVIFGLLSGISAFVVSIIIVIVIIFISSSLSNSGLGGLAWIVLGPMLVVILTGVLTPLIYQVFRKPKIPNQEDNLK